MSRYAIKLLTNLKISGTYTLPKGKEFIGSLEEFPESVQSLFREKSLSIAVRELPPETAPVEVPVDDVVETTVSEVSPPKETTKRATTRSRKKISK